MCHWSAIPRRQLNLLFVFKLNGGIELPSINPRGGSSRYFLKPTLVDDTDILSTECHILNGEMVLADRTNGRAYRR